MMNRLKRTLITLDSVVAVAGVAGGIWMMTHSTTMMPLDLLDKTPFTDWLLPGMALTFFVGVLPALAAASQVKSMPIAKWAHLGVGLGLVAWITLEAAWIVREPFLQISCLAIGTAITVLAVMNLRRDASAPESTESRHQTLVS